MAQSSSSGEEDFRVEQCTPAKKTKRGPSLMLDLIRRHRDAGTKITVEFSDTGYPLGKIGDKWRSYLGAVVRTRVPIDYKDWRKVPSEVKDVMWNEAMEVFVGPERYKEQEVKYASSAWRNFKSRLATDYIFGKKKDEDPTKEYQYIDSAQWKKFVEHRLSEDARKLSGQNKALAGKNEYAHIMGRGGYRKVKEVLINEKLADLIAQGEIEEGATPAITVERYEVWKRARLRKNEGFVTPRVRIVAENIDQLVEKSSQGSFSPHGRHDILTEAIGTPEYPGRTRGVGTHVPWKIGFPKSTSSRTTPSSRTSHVDMPDRLGRHCHVDVDPMTNIPAGGRKCVLFIHGIVEGDREQVAIGRVMTGHFINYRQIPEHTLKVKVEKALIRTAKLPIPHANLKILIEAESHHVAWPEDLVVVSNKDYDNIICLYLPIADDESIECLSLYCRLLNEVWTRLNRFMLMVDVDQSVFGDDYVIAVNTNDLNELYKTAALGNFASELYICSLNNEMMGWDIKFGFFNPSIMTPTINRDERLMTFVARLSMPDRDRNFCYFLPYVDLVKWHWMLCVIFPKQHVAHWLDPNIGDKGINSDAKDLVDTGLYRYYQGCIPRNTQSVRWKIVTCPQQPPGHLCGYYVMNFIRDIIQLVRANNGAEIDDLSQCFPNGSESYEHSKIDEVREMIAAYLYNYISDRYPVVLGQQS